MRWRKPPPADPKKEHLLVHGTSADRQTEAHLPSQGPSTVRQPPAPSGLDDPVPPRWTEPDDPPPAAVRPRRSGPGRTSRDPSTPLRHPGASSPPRPWSGARSLLPKTRLLQRSGATSA